MPQLQESYRMMQARSIQLGENNAGLQLVWHSSGSDHDTPLAHYCPRWPWRAWPVFDADALALPSAKSSVVKQQVLAFAQPSQGFHVQSQGPNRIFNRITLPSRKQQRCNRNNVCAKI